jgi:hypothetical protein
MHMRISSRLRPTAVLVTALFALMPGAPAAWSQPRPDPGRPADRTSLASCLRENASEPSACLGTIVAACMRQQEGPASGREIGCLRREQAAWRDRIDASLQVMSRTLDSGQRARLAALQRSFESYAAEKCALAADLATPARSGLTGSFCDLREVALRSIELERQARRLAPGAGPSAGPRRER